MLTHHKDVADSVALVSSVHVSILSTLFAKELLGSGVLPSIIQTSKERLRDAYVETTTTLKRAGIVYLPSHAAVFLFCKLASNAATVEQEIAAFQKYMKAGVMVVPGPAYHANASQRGWMRLTFAVNPDSLRKGLKIIESVYRSLQQEV